MSPYCKKQADSGCLHNCLPRNTIQGSTAPLPYLFVHSSLRRDVPGDNTRHPFGDISTGVYTTFIPDEFADISMTISGFGACHRLKQAWSNSYISL